MEDELPVAGGGMMNEGRMWIVRSSDRAYSIPGSRADPASLTTCFRINSENPRYFGVFLCLFGYILKKHVPKIYKMGTHPRFHGYENWESGL